MYATYLRHSAEGLLRPIRQLLDIAAIEDLVEDKDVWAECM